MPSSPGGPQIQLEGVRKVFGDSIVAVDGADLTVEDGELFAILGPSGSGKTTVLRMIAGFEQPTAGTIRLGGVDVTALPARRRDVNTVFQEYALFPHMTVAQNVEYGMKVRGVPRRTSGAPARPTPSRWSGSPTTGRASPRSSRAASVSASPWPGLWWGGPRCCCSTNRSARSTSNCASRCRWSSRPFSAKWGSPSSSSPTIRTRPSPSATGSRCSTPGASSRWARPATSTRIR